MLSWLGWTIGAAVIIGLALTAIALAREGEKTVEQL